MKLNEILKHRFVIIKTEEIGIMRYLHNPTISPFLMMTNINDKCRHNSQFPLNLWIYHVKQFREEAMIYNTKYIDKYRSVFLWKIFNGTSSPWLKQVLCLITSPFWHHWKSSCIYMIKGTKDGYPDLLSRGMIIRCISENHQVITMQPN